MANGVAIDGGEILLSIAIDGGEVSLSEAIEDGGTVFMPLLPDAYAGETTVTPSEQTQVLHTQNLMLGDDIVISPIPTNYGLITWNGRGLKVS